jgi:SAM-dependent methyltransferase
MSTIKANDLRWCVLFLFERLFASKSLNIKRLKYEREKQLPGLNTINYNRKEWSNYNWDGGGEEWTDSIEWKTALIKEVMHVYIKPQSVILEIGPGGGRWSVELVKLANQLILVDLTAEAIHASQKKLSSYSQCAFYQNDGRSLSMLGDSSVDYVWSFDVFVHISPGDTADYISEISRVLKPGGIAVIHHPYDGGLKGGFRSGVTNNGFLENLKVAELELLTQISKFGYNGQFDLLNAGDIISVFRKPQNIARD